MVPIEEKKKQEVGEIPVVEVPPVATIVPEEPPKRVPRQIIDEMVEGKRRVTIVY